MSTTVDEPRTLSLSLKLSDLSGLNGEIGNLLNSDSRESNIHAYFCAKYAAVKGKLNVDVTSSHVRLTWFHPRHIEEADAIHKQALSYARIKNYKDAISSWVRAISINPDSPDYYFNLGIAFFEGKNYKEAIENLTIALKLCPIYYKAVLILGTVYLKIRKFDQAEGYLTESLIFYPKHPLAYLNLGAVYSIQKAYALGAQMFERAIQLSPGEVRAFFGLAKIYSLTGDYSKASDCYKQVIKLNASEQLTNLAQRALLNVSVSSPETSEGSFNFDNGNMDQCYQQGYAAFLACDYTKAAKLYQLYLKQKQDDDFVLYSLGEACLRAGNLAGAVDAFTKAISVNSGKALYYKELAIANNYLGNKEQTVKNIEKAEELGHEDSISNTIWGKVLLEEKNFVAALQKLEKAVSLNSNNLLAKYNLSIALIKTDRRSEAIGILSEITNSPIRSPIKAEAERLIENLS